MEKVPSSITLSLPKEDRKKCLFALGNNRKKETLGLRQCWCLAPLSTTGRRYSYRQRVRHEEQDLVFQHFWVNVSERMFCRNEAAGMLNHLLTNGERSVCAKWHSRSMWDWRVKKNRESVALATPASSVLRHRLSRKRKCACWERREIFNKLSDHLRPQRFQKSFWSNLQDL